MKFAKKLIHNILDTVFPVKCLGCGKYNYWLCNNCLKNINNFSYENKLLKNAIHVFKYKFVKDLAKPLSKLLIKKINFDYNYIVPVPLHKKRLHWRGFNQSELLAKQINKNKTKNILVKIKNTKPQAELSGEQREQNIQNSFVCIKNLNNKKILLIDDVKTTGSTLRECKQALIKAGAKKVYYLTLAKT